jgi:excisionase family DNA binding protein
MQLISISEAASRCAVSARMIRKLIETGELPSVKFGRCRRLRQDDVEALIRRGYTGKSTTEQQESQR